MTINKKNITLSQAAAARYARDQHLVITVRSHDDLGTRRTVPLDEARRLFVPDAFEATFVHRAHERDDKPRLPSLRLVFTALEPGAQPMLREATVGADSASDRGVHDLEPDYLRRIPWADYIKYAIAVAAAATSYEHQERDQEEVNTRGKVARMSLEVGLQAQFTFDELVQRPVGRPRLEEVIDLEEVARVAREGQPTPTKAVMNHWTLKRSTARRWIKRAEAAGFDSASRRRPSGNES